MKTTKKKARRPGVKRSRRPRTIQDATPAQEKNDVFVVVLDDRQGDPMISVHLTREGADARVEEHKASHVGKDWHAETVDDVDWVRYERVDSDDGPSVRVQHEDLEP